MPDTPFWYQAKPTAINCFALPVFVPGKPLLATLLAKFSIQIQIQVSSSQGWLSRHGFIFSFIKQASLQHSCTIPGCNFSRGTQQRVYATSTPPATFPSSRCSISLPSSPQLSSSTFSFYPLFAGGPAEVDSEWLWQLSLALMLGSRLPLLQQLLAAVFPPNVLP